MRGPECPTHGDDILRLARGELDAGGTARAEEALATCEVCASWQRAALENEAVSAGVAAGFEAFFAARSRSARGRRLASLAAAVLVAFGGFLAWRLTDSGSARQDRHSRLSSRGQSQAAERQPPEEWMQEFDFSAQQPIFEDRLETGDLSAWSARN